ncbi:hypothetical protein COTS27_01516 [Spirochaetota bacterium]|nr:hypothetical protein COTS27_01516 [Spirochaetota bacterium]
MLTLKRTLAAEYSNLPLTGGIELAARHSNLPPASCTQKPLIDLRIWLSVITNQVKNHSHRLHLKKNTHYPLTTLEKKDFLLFPNTAARTKWIYTHMPDIIVWDVQSKGLALIKKTSHSSTATQQKIFHIVLDSKQNQFTAYADYLIRSLPFLSSQDNIKVTAHSKAKKPQHANLSLSWHLLMPRQSSNTGTASTINKKQPKKLRASLIEKYSTQQGWTPLANANLKTYSVVYIGGIKKIAYWKHVYKQVIALAVYDFLIKIDAYKKNTDSNKIDAQNIVKRNGMVTVLPDTMILIDDVKEGYLLWKLTLANELARYHKYVSRHYHDLAKFKQLQKHLLTRTHFLKRLSEVHYRLLLKHANRVFTHPSLTARNALILGIPLWVSAPTPYLQAIAKQDFSAFFKAPAELLQTSLADTLKLANSTNRHNGKILAPLKRHMADIIRHTERAQNDYLRARMQHKKEWNIVTLLNKFLLAEPSLFYPPCPQCCRKYRRQQLSCANNKGSDPTRLLPEYRTSIVGRAFRFNTLQCSHCKTHRRGYFFRD